MSKFIELETHWRLKKSIPNEDNMPTNRMINIDQIVLYESLDDFHDQTLIRLTDGTELICEENVNTFCRHFQ